MIFPIKGSFKSVTIMLNNMAHLTTFFILISTVTFVTGFAPEFFRYKEGQRFFFANDKNGKLTLVDLKEIDNNAKFNAATDVVLRLYTRKNKNSPDVLKNGDVNSLTNSNFDRSKAVKIIIHGWNNDGFSEVNTLVKDSFLNALDVNVITVDWGIGANVIYTTAVNNVPLVGKFLGSFIDWLSTQGAPVSNFHVMGHSLGSHISGIACRSVTKGKIPYLTGFDPALPLWDANSQRIRPSDAAYVEIIHTNADVLGISVPVGHNDFYPNGGSTQPGCGTVSVDCSHGRSFQYFAYSLDNTKFQAQLCANYKEAMNKNCSNLGTLHMGGSKPKLLTNTGSFYLTTSSSPPYYQ